VGFCFNHQRKPRWTPLCTVGIASTFCVGESTLL